MNVAKYDSYIAEIEKKAEILKSTIDTLVEDHTNELRESISYELIPSVARVLEAINSNRCEITGKEMGQIFNDDIFTNFRIVDKKI